MDRCLGAVIGAALGDAIGTTVEFKKKVSEEEIKHCLTCPGQGPFQLEPGQITDDT